MNIYKKIINYFRREKHMCINCKHHKIIENTDACHHESRIEFDYVTGINNLPLCSWYNRKGRCKKFNEK